LVRNALIQIISQAVEELLKNQVIDQSVKLVSVEIEPPKQADHGDFATNFCLVASKAAKTNPRALAETLLPAILAADLRNSTGETSVFLPRTGEGQGGVDEPNSATSETGAPINAILSAEIAGPGFINFKLNPAWAAQFLTDVIQNPDDFYKPQNVHPKKINVEHVSVNPNGPITIGSGRGAAFGSALCNVLEAAGNTVHREYYINDGVNSEQMRLFAISVKAIIEGREVPENGYKGDYVVSVATSLPQIIESMVQDLDLEYIDGSRYLDTLIQNRKNDLKSLLLELYEKEDLAEFFESKERQEAFWAGTGRIILPNYDEVASETKKQIEGLRTSIYYHRVALKALEYQVQNQLTPKQVATRIADYDPDTIRALSEGQMILAQKSDLSIFQTNFDTWFSEQSLHDSGEVEKTLQQLIANGVADDKPIRTKVVMAKGGQIKEVLKEAQPTDDEETDIGEVPLPTTGEGQGGVDETDTATGETSAQSNKTIWLRSTKFGDDQDRVLKRKDGRLTYIASDVAYHKDKFNRPANGDKLITVLGPDHHGYIARLTAVVAAMFSDQVEPLDNPEPLNEHEALIYDSVADRNQCQAALAWAKEHLEVQIFQLVRFLKDGKPAPMRKRDGNIYALIDLINEIGATLKPEGTEAEKQQAGSDVARFFYLMRHHDTAMDFDLELATKQSDENPVFYVQYAHARICSVIDKAATSGISSDGWPDSLESGNRGGTGLRPVLENLQHPKELTLILKICDLQNEVARTAEDYSVNRLTTYAIELARTYHSFYDSCRVIQPDQPELSQARLALCHATRLALQAALKLLGVSAPNRMERSV
jgi:arginyl-tRNA synthetase